VTTTEPVTADAAPATLELQDSSSLLSTAGSSDLLSARDRLRDRFRHDGYLFFRRRLPADAVARVRDDVTRVLLDEDVVTDATLRPRAPVPTMGSARYLEMLRPLIALESLHRLAYHDAIVDPVRLITGEDEVVVHRRKVIRLCHPHVLDPISTTGAHQDHTYVQGGADGLTVWVPLTEAPRERGALAVLVGSGREGVRPITKGSSPWGSGPTAPEAGDAGRWASADFAAGDVLVLHGFTVHRSLPNLTETTRVSLDLRYRGVSQPLALPEMWPPNHPDLGEWSELTAGWSSTDWLRVPETTRIVGIRRSDQGLAIPASALMGTPAATLPPL
jgi:ectoine hydroxylase-related dioxygenase (phytanoyl-CoA dioxygenase family)